MMRAWLLEVRVPAWLLAQVVLLALGACAGSAATQEASPKLGSAETEPCGALARKLCDELGPSSESCRATMGVIGFLPDSACHQGLVDFPQAQERMRELRAACDTLAKHVCAELGEDSESCAALRADLPNIPPGHCAALQRDEQQIIAALKARQALDTPLGTEQWQALTGGGAPSLGAPDAAVTIVEFSDFQCPYCAEAARTLKRVKQEHGDAVRVVFRQFPLPFHDRAQPAARAALAAHAQSKFWEYHDLLFENQRALAAQDLEAYATRLSLDVNKFRAALEDEALASRVREDIELGERVNVRGTPTVFVNGTRLENGVEYESVAAAVAAALAKSVAEPAAAPASEPAGQ